MEGERDRESSNWRGNGSLSLSLALCCSSEKDFLWSCLNAAKKEPKQQTGLEESLSPSHHQNVFLLFFYFLLVYLAFRWKLRNISPPSPPTKNELKFSNKFLLFCFAAFFVLLEESITSSCLLGGRGLSSDSSLESLDKVIMKVIDFFLRILKILSRWKSVTSVSGS